MASQPRPISGEGSLRWSPVAQAIAVDLAGFGRSEQPAGSDWSAEEHERRLERFLFSLGSEPVVLVGHDWGAFFALTFAMRHPDRVAGLVLMEAILPIGLERNPGRDALATQANETRGAIFAMAGAHGAPGGVDSAVVLAIVLGEFLTKGTVRTLTEDERAAYAAPFRGARSMAPLVALPGQIPRTRTSELVIAYGQWLEQSPVPKLFLFVTPGLLGPPAQRAWVASTLSHATIVDLGAGIHFVQEDHPEAIGQAIQQWLMAEVGPE